MTDEPARSDKLREALHAELHPHKTFDAFDCRCAEIAERLAALAAPAAEPREGLPCCGHPAEEHLRSGGCCMCPCPTARPTSAAAQPGPSDPGLREALTDRRYRHANVAGTDPVNGQPMRVCATDRQAWPCEVVATIDEVLAALAAPAAEPRDEFRNDIECYCRRGLTESCWSHRHRWVDTGEELAHVACEPHGHDEPTAAAQPGPGEPGLDDALARYALHSLDGHDESASPPPTPLPASWTWSD